MSTVASQETGEPDLVMCIWITSFSIGKRPQWRAMSCSPSFSRPECDDLYGCLLGSRRVLNFAFLVLLRYTTRTKEVERELVNFDADNHGQRPPVETRWTPSAETDRKTSSNDCYCRDHRHRSLPGNRCVVAHRLYWRTALTSRPNRSFPG
jgi:hypothetical protein